MFFKNIIDEIIIEDETHAFYSQLSNVDICSWLKTIVGFANNLGGDLYVGVDKTNQELFGFTLNDYNNLKEFIINQINLHIFPKPSYIINQIGYSNKDEIRYIMLVHVIKSDKKPLILRLNDCSMIFIRRNGYTSGAELDEIQDMVLKCKDNYNYDREITDIKYKREHFNSLFNIYSKNHRDNLSENELIQLGFMDKNYMLSNAAVLFMDNCKHNNMIKLCSYSGIIDYQGALIQDIELDCNIFKCIIEALKFITINTILIAKDCVDINKNDDPYHKDVIIKALINGFIYRDYNNNSPILVKVFKNRVEIISPGKLVEDISNNIIYNISTINPKVKNPLIIDVVKLLEPGFNSINSLEFIAEKYKSENKFHKPFLKYSTKDFMIVLPNINDKVGVSRVKNNFFVYKELSQRSNYDEAIVNICYKRELKAKDIAKELNISYSSYLINVILQNLVDNNILNKIKRNRICYYITNDEAVTMIK